MSASKKDERAGVPNAVHVSHFPCHQVIESDEHPMRPVASPMFEADDPDSGINGIEINLTGHRTENAWFENGEKIEP